MRRRSKDAVQCTELSSRPSKSWVVLLISKYHPSLTAKWLRIRLGFALCALLGAVSVRAEGPAPGSSLPRATGLIVEARLLPGRDYRVVFRPRGHAVEVTLTPKHGPAGVVHRTLPVGHGPDALCASTVHASVQTVRFDEEVECGEDLLCRAFQGYGLAQRTIGRKTGLEAVRIDDDACDAIWLYYSPRSKEFELRRVN